MKGENCIMGVGIDISDKVKSQQELKESEEKYRLLFNQNPMPMAMISMPDRQFIDVNAAAIEFTRLRQESFRSMNIRDLRAPDDETMTDMQAGRTGINNTGVWRHRKERWHHCYGQSSLTMWRMKAKRSNCCWPMMTEKILAEEKLKKIAWRPSSPRHAPPGYPRRWKDASPVRSMRWTGATTDRPEMDISWLSKKSTARMKRSMSSCRRRWRWSMKRLKTVRRIATQLRPSILDDLGLVFCYGVAERWIWEEVQDQIRVFHSVWVILRSITRWPQEYSGFSRNALTNVLRHSKATEVKSMLTTVNGTLRLMVTDNGVGFNTPGDRNQKHLVC